MGTSKPMTAVPLFDLKFLDRMRHLALQELQIGGTRRSLESECQILTPLESHICQWPLILTFAKVPAANGERMLESDH